MSIPVDPEAEYVCPSCGELIVIPVDVIEGDEQEVVEDCPVCCRPNRIQIFLAGENAHATASPLDD
jgi:hypothetical protein